MIRPENMDDDPQPLTDDELDALEELSYAATMRPWQIEREQIGLSDAGRDYGLKGTITENTIHTAWDHAQAKGPAPVLTTAFSPFYTAGRSIYLRENDADFIVAACNATRRLITEVRKLRDERRSPQAIHETKESG